MPKFLNKFRKSGGDEAPVEEADDAAGGFEGEDGIEGPQGSEVSGGESSPPPVSAAPSGGAPPSQRSSGGGPAGFFKKLPGKIPSFKRNRGEDETGPSSQGHPPESGSGGDKPSKFGGFMQKFHRGDKKPKENTTIESETSVNLPPGYPPQYAVPQHRPQHHDRPSYHEYTDSKQEAYAMDTFKSRISAYRSSFSPVNNQAPGFDYMNWKPYASYRDENTGQNYLNQCHALAPYVRAVVVSACQGVEERRWMGVAYKEPPPVPPSRMASREILNRSRDRLR